MSPPLNDAERTDQAIDLVLSGRAGEVDPDAIGAVALDLRLRAMRLKAPDLRDLLERGQAGQARRWLRPWVRLVMGTAVVISLAVATILLPQPSDAVEIARRAELVAADPAGGGLSSFAGVIDARIGLGGLYLGATDQTTPLPSIHRVWFRAPDSYRIEVTPGTGLPVSLVVVTGDRGWLVLPAEGLAMEQEFGTGGSVLFPSLSETLADLATRYDVTRVGAAEVAGRTTHELRLRPLAGTSGAEMVGSLDLSIDAEYFVQLRGVVRDRGGALVASWSFLEFTPNVAVDSELLEYSPPPGMRIVRSEAEAAGAPKSLDLWQSVAAASSFDVFAPRYVPPKLAPGFPSREPTGGVVTVSYRSEGDPRAVFMLQYPRPVGPVPGRAVELGGERIGALDARAGEAVLRIDLGGTRVELRAGPTVPIPELERMAASLEQVVRRPSP